jgi:hypothetical protein
MRSVFRSVANLARFAVSLLVLCAIGELVVKLSRHWPAGPVVFQAVGIVAVVAAVLAAALFLSGDGEP